MKKFEDHLADIQTDMVAVCVEYADHQADDLYIYCSFEPNMYAFDVFYRINGQVVRKHQLNQAVRQSDSLQSHQYNVTDARQLAMLEIGIENLKEIHKKCEEHNHQMPTEIKLHYDMKQNKLSGKYRYDLVYSNSEELLPDHIFDAWFEEVRSQDN